MPVIRLGLALMCLRRPSAGFSKANPRSPRERKSRSSAFLVRASASSSWFPGGSFTGTRIPIPAPYAERRKTVPYPLFGIMLSCCRTIGNLA
jgi:hypothetical protein